MTYVMEMSTDPDILATALDPSWAPITARYAWAAVNAGTCAIPVGQTIVVIAHGNQDEIGNAGGPPSLDASDFFVKMLQNVVNGFAGGAPARLFISACAPNGIAQFAAGVRLQAQGNGAWANTRIFGHTSSVSGPVPPYTPVSLDWTEIFP